MFIMKRIKIICPFFVYIICQWYDWIIEKLCWYSHIHHKVSVKTISIYDNLRGLCLKIQDLLVKWHIRPECNGLDFVFERQVYCVNFLGLVPGWMVHSSDHCVLLQNAEGGFLSKKKITCNRPTLHWRTYLSKTCLYQAN